MFNATWMNTFISHLKYHEKQWCVSKTWASTMTRFSSQQFIHNWSTERVWSSEYDEHYRHHVHSFLPTVSKTCMWQIYRAHMTVENVWTHAGIIGTQSQAILCTRHAIKLYFKIFCMILVPLGQWCPTFFLFVRVPQPLLQAGTWATQVKIIIIGIP